VWHIIPQDLTRVLGFLQFDLLSEKLKLHILGHFSGDLMLECNESSCWYGQVFKVFSCQLVNLSFDLVRLIEICHFESVTTFSKKPD
jgi:hypothetical protein